MKRFFNSKPYEQLVELADDGVNEAHKIKLTKAFPAGVTSVAVEAIEGLRSALDQAAFATALLGGVKKSRSAYFPVAGSEAELEKTIKGRCKDIPSEIISLFRTFKPYKTGNDLLWALNNACNVNKHGIVVPVGMSTAGVNYKNVVVSGSCAIPAPIWNQEKAELVLATTAPGTTIQYDISTSFYVAFGEVDGIGGQPAVPVLTAMANEVHRIVTATESEAQRLGLLGRQ